MCGESPWKPELPISFGDVLLQKRRNGKSKEFSEQCNQVEPSISWGRRGEKDIRKFVRSPTSTAAFLLSQVKLDRDQRDPVCVRKVIDNIWMTLASSHDSGHSPL